jgi:hypothetical protein
MGDSLKQITAGSQGDMSIGVMSELAFALYSVMIFGIFAARRPFFFCNDMLTYCMPFASDPSAD